MISKKQLLLLLTIPLMILAAGCAPDCTTSEYLSFDTILDGPTEGEIVTSLTPTLSWHHNESCTPESFVAFITKDGSVGVNSTVTSGLNSFLSPDSALQPGGSYTWLVFPHRASPPIKGPKTSTSRTFYTGPICSGDPLVTPVLTYPEDKSFISPGSSYNFKWNYPGNCLPNAYYYEFASDPNFTEILKSGNTPNHYQYLDETFPDCSTVFWRVAAMDGSTVGPFSDTHKFTWVTDSKCWQNHLISLDSADISGHVYNDKCPQTNFYVPLGNPFILDPACKITGGIGIHANGLFAYSYPEQGLSDVRIDLGAGPCPSIGLDHKNTSSGYYKFVVLTPGVYCLSITNQQTSSTDETGDLTKGIWTEPLTKQDVTGVTITLEDGYHDIKQNFGWDKIEQLFAMFKLEVPTNCRAWPGMDSNVEAIILAGDSVPLIGQVAASDWKLAVVSEKLCYIYLPGSFDLPEVDPPPEPKPTPKPGGSDSCANYTREDCKLPLCMWDGSSGTCKSQ